jgi:molybdopterin-containing oxidoreductase family iron-sulfur binding subunit
MENNTKKYWKGLEELQQTPEFVKHKNNEFAEELPMEELLSESKVNNPTPRRDFLKALGFGMSAVALAACNEAPIRKAIPYLNKPEEITPGIANYYTSNYNGLGVLVKTREGRPIKIEGNPNDPISMGGTDALSQSSVLDLYDSSRLKNPTLAGKDSTWESIDKYASEALATALASGGNIRIVSNSILSPSTKAVIAEFATKYPNTKHVSYDAISYSGIINANNNSFGKAVVPTYHFENAEVIVSFGADFLGTWISPVEYTRQYVSNRSHKSLEAKKMSRHIQFETNLSITGTNADSRYTHKPSQQGIAILALYNALAKKAGAAQVAGASVPFEKIINETANELWNAKGKSLVVCGSNDVSVQVAVNAINALLGNYGTCIDLDNASNQYQGNDAEMIDLIKEMNAGEVEVVMFYNANPSYNYAKSSEFNAALKKVKAKISFADRADETAVLCDAVAPTTHYLESWDDASARKGVYSVIQPTISPVYNVRSAQQSLLTWAGSTMDYFAFIRNYWEKNIYSQIPGFASFTSFWENALQKGVVTTSASAAQAYSFNNNLTAVAETIISASKNAGKTELYLYSSVALRDGAHANNPWLLELPDPVSKVTWDNYAAINPKYAEELGLKQNSLVNVKSGDVTVVLPLLMQPGQAMGTISVALGYGRTNVGKAGNGVGVNMYPMVSLSNGTFQYFNTSVEISAAEGSYELAQTQTHHTFEGRDIIREKSLAAFVGGSHTEHKAEHVEAHAAVVPGHETKTTEEKEGHGATNESHENVNAELWPAYESKGHHWGMAIDLNACTGCGACVVACSAENNVPVVGRDEVRRRREMHWLRIDRYYTFESADGKDITKEKEYKQVDNYENVKVAHQPMMCQHCDHAPCETVCPVLATMHSSEGLNQMAYNRCVGTRYCANNCPYKVRRFNWFNYWNDDRFVNFLHDDAAYLALNPDVTTRSRGVMEKCSFCAQRIQAGKLEAKIEKRPLKDGDVKSACQQGCPANAIVFGDVNDPNSEVAKLIKSNRTYFVLEEINVQPGVGYMTKVRNTIEA